jgi:spore coat polysaccharide biosynthesis protein SpsF (cytidylyltransferase family)
MNLGIIQARMGSTRLPGKVLVDIHGKSLLEHCISRLSNSKKIDKWIVATTTEASDDAIELACSKIGVACYRGSEWDVLDRYYQAAISQQENPNIIVRICCDNPIHNGEVVDYAMDEFQKFGTDYFSNGNEGPIYSEDGITTEVFTFDSLKKAWQESTLLSEREHVTPYIKKSGKFSCAWRKYSSDYSFKLSVDTPNDLTLCSTIFKELGNDFTIDRLISFLKQHSDLLKINEDSILGEGYLKSLKEDKIVK